MHAGLGQQLLGPTRKGFGAAVGIAGGLPFRIELSFQFRQFVVLEDALAQVVFYPPSQVRLLLDEQATKSNIVDALRELAATAKPDDTVVIFYSGHGGRRPDAPEYAGYLYPADYVPGDPDGTGLLAQDLTELLNAIPAARVVLLMDACHAEAAAHVKAEGESKAMLPGFRDASLEKLSSGSGRVVIASCRETEVSMTSTWRGHSLFTHFLLEGLRGQARGADDGTVRVLDLFTYLSEQVPANPVDKKVQHPVLRARTENNFPLALRKGGWFKGEDAAAVQAPAPAPAAPAVRTLAPNSLTIDWRKVAPVMAQLYPSGPGHNEIWSRAGGDPSALSPAGSGQAAWHAALRMIHNGGGGTITMGTLPPDAFGQAARAKAPAIAPGLANCKALITVRLLALIP